jgi:hypothetical protein
MRGSTRADTSTRVEAGRCSPKYRWRTGLMRPRSAMSVMNTWTLTTWSGRPPAARRQVSMASSAIWNCSTVSSGIVPSARIPTMPDSQIQSPARTTWV